MSSNRNRRENMHDDLERGARNRERHRSRSPDRHYRRNRRTRSRSRDQHNAGRDKRTLRYGAHRPSTSRSKSRSPTRSYSRSHRRSRTPNNSHNKRRSRSNDRKHERSNRHAEDIDCKKESTAAQATLPHTDDSRKVVVERTQTHDDSVEHLPLPKREAIGDYYNLDTKEPIDKQKIHREMEEKLRTTLAKMGKVYPPPKPAEPSHPVFANDGSFIEIFKKMQQAQQGTVGSAAANCNAEQPTTSAAAFVAATAAGRPVPPPPMVGRRRGGKILKTGMVAKPKAQGEESSDPKDFWAIYLREVNKYKNNSCDTDTSTRPLVK